MPEITASGIRFHVQRLPAHRPTANSDHPAQPPTVVFVHGLVVDNMSGFYYTLANPAARVGAEVILYDMRGHGGTERPPTGYSLDAAVSDLIAVLDALGVTTPVHLVGNSFGGTIALALAMKHPDRVARLLLIEAAVVTEDWVAKLGGMLAKGMELRGGLVTWRAEHGRRLYRIHTAIDALVNGTTLAADLKAIPPFPSAALRSIHCPVMAAYGEESDIIDHAHLLEHLLPDCELTVVPGCTHFLLAEAPGAVRNLLLRQLCCATEVEQLPVETAPVP